MRRWMCCWTRRRIWSPALVASFFRMGHAFITLRRLDQAERVAAEAIHALSPLAELHDCPPETLSLYGAMHVILSVVYAREGNRQATRRTLDQARQIAARVGPGRNDYNTEFGPTNVELYAVAAAVDLGDAGEALDLAGRSMLLVSRLSGSPGYTSISPGLTYNVGTSARRWVPCSTPSARPRSRSRPTPSPATRRGSCSTSPAAGRHPNSSNWPDGSARPDSE
jgi:hypothetical protein